MEIKLDVFEGPFDLLFHLIEKNEIDIYDIPVAVLTDQYMAVIAAFPRGMDGMSEFLLMAATLLELKSRMLLPKPPGKEDEAEAEDPRDALVRKLLEYKRCQTLANLLKSVENPGERVVRQPERLLKKELKDAQPLPLVTDVSLESLWHIFSDVIRRRELKIDRVRAQFGEVPRERFTIEEKAALIENELKRTGRLRLSSLLEDCATRGEMVVTFLALLEMIRRSRVTVRQSDTFGDVEVM